MTTFTPEQQKEHRDAFIEECRQKIWGAACHADWIVKGLDQLTADYTKLKAEDDKLSEEIKNLELSPVSHTKENRDKRKALQERRTVLAKQMQAIGQSHQQGQAAVASFYQSIEANLALAKHAEKWEWKEANPTDARSSANQK